MASNLSCKILFWKTLKEFLSCRFNDIRTALGLVFKSEVHQNLWRLQEKSVVLGIIMCFIFKSYYPNKDVCRVSNVWSARPVMWSGTFQNINHHFQNFSWRWQSVWGCPLSSTSPASSVVRILVSDPILWSGPEECLQGLTGVTMWMARYSVRTTLFWVVTLGHLNRAGSAQVPSLASWSR